MNKEVEERFKRLESLITGKATKIKDTKDPNEVKNEVNKYMQKYGKEQRNEVDDFLTIGKNVYTEIRKVEHVSPEIAKDLFKEKLNEINRLEKELGNLKLGESRWFKMCGEIIANATILSLLKEIHRRKK